LQSVPAQGGVEGEFSMTCDIVVIPRAAAEVGQRPLQWRRRRRARTASSDQTN
jgi:hypothetical protein